MTIIYAADGTTFAPKGVNSGMPASNSWTRKLSTASGLSLQEVCEAGEKMLCFACGGGYGDPARRNRSRVVETETVNRGWLTAEKAQEIYGVSLRYDEAAAEYVVAG
jgi:N-methylhydantoinase B